MSIIPLLQTFAYSSMIIWLPHTHTHTHTRARKGKKTLSPECTLLLRIYGNRLSSKSLKVRRIVW